MARPLQFFVLAGVICMVLASLTQAALVDSVDLRVQSTSGNIYVDSRRADATGHNLTHEALVLRRSGFSYTYQNYTIHHTDTDGGQRWTYCSRRPDEQLTRQGFGLDGGHYPQGLWSSQLRPNAEGVIEIKLCWQDNDAFRALCYPMSTVRRKPPSLLSGPELTSARQLRDGTPG